MWARSQAWARKGLGSSRRRAAIIDLPEALPPVMPITNADTGILSPAGVAESAGAAAGCVQLGDKLNLYTSDGSDDQLGDPIAAIDGEGFGAMVNEEHTELASIVGVDGAGRVQHCDTVFGGEAAAGANLALVAGGEGDTEAGRDELGCSGEQGGGSVDSGAEVETCCSLGHVGGRWQVMGLRELLHVEDGSCQLGWASWIGVGELARVSQDEFCSG